MRIRLRAIIEIYFGGRTARERLATARRSRMASQRLRNLSNLENILYKLTSILLKKRVSRLEKKNQTSNRNALCLGDMWGYLVGSNIKRG